MIPVYAFSVFLWVCLNVQAPAQGAAVKITKVARKDNGTHFTLVAKFKSDDMPVEVQWWKYSAGIYEYVEATKHTSGKTELVVSKTDKGKIILKFGDLKSQFWVVDWNTNGDGDKTISPDVTMSTVIPSTDVVHEPGTISQVTVRVDENRGKGIKFYSPKYLPTGKYLKDNYLKGAEVLPFMNASYSSENGVTTTLLSFGHGWTDPIQAIVSGPLEVDIPYRERDNFPVSALEEHITMKVHAPSNSGPLPDDMVIGRLGMSDCKERWPGYTPCAVSCSAYANDLDKESVTLLKVVNGVEVELEGTTVAFSTSFGYAIRLELDPKSPDTPGEYVCKAQSRNGYSAREARTLTISRR